MKKLKFFGLISLLICLLACGQTAEKNAQTKSKNDWKVLNENGYSIQYPDNWDLNTSGQMGTSFILFSKLSSEQDKFKENVNLLIQDLTGKNIDLDKYVEISEGQIKTMVTNGNILESKKLNSSGNDFHKVVYTGDQGVYKLKYEQYYWIKNNAAYVLTLTCESSQFDSFKDTGEKILNSFVLK